MDQAFRDVIAFEVAAGRAIPDKPGPLSVQDLMLARQLVGEEWIETNEALGEAILTLSFGDPVRPKTLAAAADGLADLAWVCLAAAVRLGIDLPAVWERVKAANMAKFGEGSWTDENGKVRKPPSWQTPDVEGVIRTQRPILETYGEKGGEA